MELSHSTIKDLLEYNEITGDLTWKMPEISTFSFLGERAGGYHKRFIRKRAGKTAYANLMPSGYYRLKIFGKVYFTHRVIWFLQTGEWPDQVDHNNGDKSDNRWENLRNVSHRENMRNRKAHKNNKLGVPGVYASKDRIKYRAQIRVDGKKVNLGSFLSLEDASKAYQEAIVYYGFNQNHSR